MDSAVGSHALQVGDVTITQTRGEMQVRFDELAEPVMVRWQRDMTGLTLEPWDLYRRGAARAAAEAQLIYQHRPKIIRLLELALAAGQIW